MRTALPPASARVYESIKRGILDGTHPCGALLTEGELADATGVSRTPVREALLRLETEGLVKLYPKKGALVVPVSVEEGRELLEARAVIEDWAAYAAWPARAALADTLRGHLDDMRTARRAADIAAFTEADRHFHEAIVEAGGNAILLRTYRTLRDRQLVLMAADLRMPGSRMDASLRAHEHLLHELEAGTRTTFREASRAHLHAAGARLRGEVAR
ncbi:MAG TPA: GntR family transcriptional regulator [Dermatophilaceae bacterium]|nr:GntR family transcriptional regulator [Dermatophilaceae bacterium]